MTTFTLDASQGARLLSGEFNYKNLSGDTFYYDEDQGVSSGGTAVAVGSTLSRRSPSWVISAGQSHVQQVPFDAEDTAATLDQEALATDIAALAAHEALIPNTAAHGMARHAKITDASVAHSALQNEKQTISVTATGGDYTITGTEGTSVAVAIDATAAQVRTAIGPCIVGGVTSIQMNSGAPDYEVEFIDVLAAIDMAPLVINDTGATGGDVTIAETVKGGTAGLSDLNALGAKINLVIDALEGAKISAAS